MFKSAILLLLCFREIFSNTTEIEFEIANRIVGGERCEIEEHPYLVAIMHAADAYFLCGGSLLSARWVLTARHCLEKCQQEHFYMVVAGVGIHSNYNWKKRGQFSLVDRCYLHRSTDLGLMHLETPMKESKSVGFVKLATYADMAGRTLEEICRNGTVMGWGMQYAVDLKKQPKNPDGKEYDPYLQCLQLPVISHDTCEERIKSLISDPLPDTHFCAYREHHDACMGDSGGPFMCDGLQYGIVSSGFGCAFRDYPGLYIKNYQFENFIKSVIFKANVTKPRNQMCSVAKNPFLVAITRQKNYRKYEHLCTGSMLTKILVLTAGVCTTHCGTPNYYTVFIGLSSLVRMDSHNLDTLSSQVDSCYQAPNRHTNQDIAIMKLKMSFELTARLSFVNFATSLDVQNTKFKDLCNSAVIIGYGPQHDVENLDCMQVSTVSQTLCKKTWNSSKIGDQHACVLTEDSEECYKELGRPLICNGVQFGVLVSIDCSEDKTFFPILIAEVYKYEEFLENMIKITKNAAVQKSKANLKNSVNFYGFIFLCFIFFGSSFLM